MAAPPARNRRRLIARRLRRQGLLNEAMFASVEEVDGEAQNQPYEQPQPRIARQGDHQKKADDNPEDGHQRHKRNPEWAMQIRTARAENQYTRADNHKDQERSSG